MANSSTTVGERVPESLRCIAIMESTAILNFEVTDYPELEDMRVGECISSPIYNAYGYDWGINFYPNGYNKYGYASAYLCYLSQANDVSVKFTLNVKGKEGQAPVASFGPKPHVFSPGKYYDWGIPDFVENSKLQSLLRLGDGSFRIQCILTTQRNESRPPPPELPGRLECLLADGTGADVTFGVGGREFRAHRCILAASSPVFHEKFFGPCSMIEKGDMLRVEVVDVEPTIFEMLLRYIYTDALPRCKDDGGYTVAVMQHLMVAAVKYRMNRLKLRCDEQLCNKLTVDTITTMLALANQHDCKRLKDACLFFMASPEVLGALLETDGYKEIFMTNCRPLTLDGEEPSFKKKKLIQAS